MVCIVCETIAAQGFMVAYLHAEVYAEACGQRVGGRTFLGRTGRPRSPTQPQPSIQRGNPIDRLKLAATDIRANRAGRRPAARSAIPPPGRPIAARSASASRKRPGTRPAAGIRIRRGSCAVRAQPCSKIFRARSQSPVAAPRAAWHALYSGRTAGRSGSLSRYRSPMAARRGLRENNIGEFSGLSSAISG
jgi:hypothetical protein